MTDDIRDNEQRVVQLFPSDRLDAPASEGTEQDQAATEESAEANESNPVDQPTRPERGSEVTRSEKRSPMVRNSE